MKAEFYSCDVCGNIVGMIKDGNGELVCCNKPMDLLEANTVDASEEKHVPVLKKEGDKTSIAIGSDAHPMVPEHFIEWVAVADGRSVQVYPLTADDEPIKEVCAPAGGEIYAYCNLHGLWKADV